MTNVEKFVPVPVVEKELTGDRKLSVADTLKLSAGGKSTTGLNTRKSNTDAGPLRVTLITGFPDIDGANSTVAAQRMVEQFVIEADEPAVLTVNGIVAEKAAVPIVPANNAAAKTLFNA